MLITPPESPSSDQSDEGLPLFGVRLQLAPTIWRDNVNL